MSDRQCVTKHTLHSQNSDAQNFQVWSRIYKSASSRTVESYTDIVYLMESGGNVSFCSSFVFGVAADFAPSDSLDDLVGFCNLADEAFE